MKKGSENQIIIPEAKVKKVMSTEVLAKIGKMLQEGKTRGQIKTALNEEGEGEVSYTDVYMAVQKLKKANPGLKVNSREENPHKAEIFRLKAEGLKCKEIAEALNLEYSQVYTTYIRDPKLG